jgi:hypothetical protein
MLVLVTDMLHGNAEDGEAGFLPRKIRSMPPSIRSLLRGNGSKLRSTGPMSQSLGL